MIIRSLLLRHGRLALPKPPSSSHLRLWRRSLSTPPPSTVEQTYTNPQAPQNYIAGAADGTKGQAVHDLTSPPRIALEDDQIARDWHFFHHQKQHTGKLGSAVQKHYKPHELVSNPPVPKDISLELLLASQAHVGHATSLWNPANAKYIFGVRGDQDPIHIISLDVTAAHLRRACKIVRGVTERGGLVLFVGSRQGQARSVVRAAENAQGCHLFSKWIPGSITNGQQILGKCRKKVVDAYDREVPGFDDQLLSKAALKPDLVVCLNPLENYVLLHECALNNIPTVGIIDTDANPTWVTYPVPANDDSLRCVELIAGVLGRAGQEGQRNRLEKANRGIVDYRQNHGLQPPSEEDEESKQRREKEQSLLAGADAFDSTQEFADEEVAQLAQQGVAEHTNVTAEQQAHVERLSDIPDLDAAMFGEEHVEGGVEKGDVPYEVDQAMMHPEGTEEKQAMPLTGEQADGEGGSLDDKYSAWTQKGETEGESVDGKQERR